MRQLCDAVKYMHDQDVLHLDLKPGTLIFCALAGATEVWLNSVSFLSSLIVIVFYVLEQIKNYVTVSVSQKAHEKWLKCNRMKLLL